MLIYTYDYNIAAFVFILLLNQIFLLKQVYRSKRNSILHIMLLIGLFIALSEASIHYINQYVMNVTLPFLYLIHLLYYLLLIGMYIAYFIFVLESLQLRKFTIQSIIVIIVSIIMSTFLTSLTICTHYIFYYDSTKVFHEGPLFYVWYIPLFFLALCSTTAMFRKHELCNRAIVVPNFYLFLLSAILIYLKMRHPNVLFSGFIMSIFLFILYFCMENDDLYFDKTIGCYNNQAFIETANSLIAAQKEYTVICFHVNEYTYVDQVLGPKAMEELNKHLTRMMYKNFGKTNIYSLYHIGYAMYVESNQKDIERVISIIQKNFNEPFSLNGRLERLSPGFCITKNPYFANNGQQLIDEMNNTFLDMKRSKAHLIAYTTGKYLSKVQREQQVIYAMNNAIKQDSFEVYYQPIFDLEKKRVRSLEALLRLNDEELGFIPPDEFIQIAEKNGMIIDISSIAFRKVCKFIHDNDITSLGIDYIEFNLSIVECDNPMLASDLLHVMQEYNVSPSQVNFEITETAQAHNVSALIQNMDRLIEAGSTFSMDDYGTGYSTTHYLIKLPLHIVKIDKSILWPAMKDKKSYNVLRQLVATIKSIDKKIVVEGVETQEMVEILDKLDCDYLQGYFYSKPVPADQIVSYLKKINKIA